MVIPMKKGILTFIITLIVFMAAVGFGKNLQTEASAEGILLLQNLVS